MKGIVFLISFFAVNVSLSQSLYDYYLSQSATLIQNGENEKASYFLEKGIKRYPDSSQMYIYRAFSYHYLDQTDSSLADLLQAQELGNKSEFIPRYLGLNYDELGEFQLAESYYREFLEVEPTDTFIVITLINVLIKQDKFSEAEESIDQFKSDYPKSIQPIFLLGVLKHQQKLYQEAIDHLTNFIELSDGKDSYGYLQRSYAYKELNMQTKMCEDIWSIRFNLQSAIGLYYDEGCEKTLGRMILPPPQEEIIETTTPPDEK